MEKLSNNVAPDTLLHRIENDESRPCLAGDFNCLRISEAPDDIAADIRTFIAHPKVLWPTHIVRIRNDRAACALHSIYTIATARCDDKPQTADEVGFTWGNQLLTRYLIPVAADHDLPLLLIGHSFGTRITSAALHGQTLLRDLGNKAVPAITSVALQPAFSVNRVRPEGHEPLYSALPPLAGSRSFFTPIQLLAPQTAACSHVPLIDVSAIFNEGESASGAHGDAYDRATAQLIFRLIDAGTGRT